MRKFTPYLLAILALGVGFVIGACWIVRMHTFLMWHESSKSTSLEANLAVAALRSIRTGDTNKAIERLEGQVDRAVISLSDICRDCPRPETERFPFRALARARDYRAQYPRTTESSAIDGAVAKALTLADDTK